jgi:membrane associated rhomboid family serine protease
MNDDNIVEFKKRKSIQQNQQPFINLPPITKYILIGLIGIHAILYLVIAPETRAEIFITFGFVPYIWTDGNLFGFNTLSYLSPLTYMGLHGNWLHLFMNGAMLMAFGAGVEQYYGARKYLIFFILCGLIALIPEILINPDMQYPLVGASGALSGLFAAILIIMQNNGRLPTGKYGIWPFAVAWVGISVFFGLFGEQVAGAPIAWLAHLGGFFGGLALIKTKYFRI